MLCFAVTLGILIGLLYLTAQIPKEVFRKNLLASAKYLSENEDEFYQIVEGDKRTLVHNYADVITFNIMYSVDGKDAWDELMMSPFYSDNINPDYPMIELLAERITEEKQADTVYDRYWHGMMVLLRPLFCVFTLSQIRMVMLTLLVGLFVLLSALLWKKGLRTLVATLWIAGILSGYPMIAICMEYVPVWLIMLLSSLAAIKLYQNDSAIANLAVANGVCCAFFDFLTTETVAIVIPLVVVLCLKNKEKQIEDFWQGVRWLLAKGVLWGVAYLGTLFTKWILSSMVLSENRIGFALSMMLKRQGDASVQLGETVFPQQVAAVLTNVRLFLGMQETVSLESVCGVVLIGAFVMLCVIYLFRKKGSACVLPGLLFLLGGVPVIRMLVLHNHSLEHCFFVYRALFATLVCMVVGVVYMIDWKMIRKLMKK